MLGTTANSQRFFKLTQLLLTFASVCAVADASRIDKSSAERPGFHSGAEQRSDTERDRRFNDLARTERKRREDEQQANRRRIATRAFGAIAYGMTDGDALRDTHFRPALIPAFGQVVAIQRHYSPASCWVTIGISELQRTARGMRLAAADEPRKGSTS